MDHPTVTNVISGDLHKRTYPDRSDKCGQYQARMMSGFSSLVISTVEQFARFALYIISAGLHGRSTELKVCGDTDVNHLY